VTILKTAISAFVFALGLTSASCAQCSGERRLHRTEQARFECDMRLKVKPPASTNTATQMLARLDELMRGISSSK
jgi:hypothetical protein